MDSSATLDFTIARSMVSRPTGERFHIFYSCPQFDPLSTFDRRGNAGGGGGA